MTLVVKKRLIVASCPPICGTVVRRSVPCILSARNRGQHRFYIAPITDPTTYKKTHIRVRVLLHLVDIFRPLNTYDTSLIFFRPLSFVLQHVFTDTRHAPHIDLTPHHFQKWKSRPPRQHLFQSRRSSAAQIHPVPLPGTSCPSTRNYPYQFPFPAVNPLTLHLVLRFVRKLLRRISCLTSTSPSLLEVGMEGGRRNWHACQHNSVGV